MSKINIRGVDIPKLRRHLLKKQDGKCLICKKVSTDVVVDHHHTKKTGGTGLIRGVLCRTCNVFLAKMENNCRRHKIDSKDLPEVLRSCAAYLERKQTRIVHPTEQKREFLTKKSYLALEKIYDGRSKFPEFPKSGKLTLRLTELFKEYGMVPVFYKGKPPKPKKVKPPTQIDMP